MGVERAVTRWYAQRQSLWNEISALEAQLEQLEHMEQQEQGQEPQPHTAASDDLIRRLAEAQEKLRQLGPCPKVMMG